MSMYEWGKAGFAFTVGSLTAIGCMLLIYYRYI
jgi:hypothetical protein